jgi:hypothetical protein
MVSPGWKRMPGGTTDFSTQLSGLMLLETMAKLDILKLLD